MEVLAPEMVYSPDGTAEIEYKITVKNLHNSKIENISVVDGNNNSVIHTFSNVVANGTATCTLKKTVPAPTEASGIHQLNQKIKATATYVEDSNKSASVEKQPVQQSMEQPVWKKRSELLPFQQTEYRHRY